jgi:hypothetical protein
MDSWIYVIGVIVILFLFSQKGIISSRNRKEINDEREETRKKEGKSSFYAMVNGWISP